MYCNPMWGVIHVGIGDFGFVLVKYASALR